MSAPINTQNDTQETAQEVELDETELEQISGGAIVWGNRGGGER